MSDPSYQAKVYAEQGSSAMVVASGGSIRFEAGSRLDLSGHGGKLSSGVAPLDIFNARIVTSASGPLGTLMSSGSAPSLKRVNASADPTMRVTWASGNSSAIQLAPVPVPLDYSTGSPMYVNLWGEKASGANTWEFAVRAYGGVGGADLGSTCGGFSSTPGLKQVALSASLMPPPPNVLNIVLEPKAHANDAGYLYGAWLSYHRSDS